MSEPHCGSPRRPLWDIVVIVLSLGGIVLGVTTLKPAWIRVRRRLRRWRPKNVLE